MSDLILETRGLTKQFKGFAAVSNVNLKVRRGTIDAVIGPNGAGKTTMFNLLTKFLARAAGPSSSTGRTSPTRMQAISHAAVSCGHSRSPPCSPS